MRVTLETQLPADLDERATQEMVRMGDGVRLATDVYLPSMPGRRPAVLVRLPYDKAGRYTFMPHVASRFVERGYAFVVQDVRGRFRSEGETVPLVHEIADGYDTLSWLVDQAWCNGEVGMFGDSYYGFTQWAAVASGHPALRAIVPRVTSADLGRWMQGEVDALYGGQYLAEVWSDRHMHTWEIDWSRRPLSEVFDEAFEAIGTRSVGFDHLLAASRDGPALDPFGDQHPFDRVSIPTLHVAGWFDNLSSAAMRDYTRLSADPRRTALQFLSVDSIDHENYHLDDIPIGPELDHNTNDAALERMLPRYLDPALDFFDAFLARTRPASIVPRVRWHVGHSGWREDPTWPPPGARPVRLSLGDAAAATRNPEGGVLMSGRSAPRETISWIHDPDDLVPSTVVNPFALLAEAPDESAVQARPDVLTFTTAAHDRDVMLAGPVTARLALDSEAPAPHVFVKLIEVDSAGRGLMLARGQTTIRYDGPVEVALGHVGIRIAAGHRLRLHIAASDFPLYAPHPGTGENPWFAAKTQPNRLTLYTGGDQGSSLELTVLGNDA